MPLRKKKDIFVTQPYLPPLKEFLPYLQEIWTRKTLTNNGPLHQRFEKALCQYLGVEHVCLLANGTLALMCALEALNITGEVITTPYSFVATAHAMRWRNITPVFVDIDPATCNLDPAQIEAAITPGTTAIVPVHTYGLPCRVDEIQRIANRHGLRVIYDAAHAFGVRYKGHSLLRHGDLAVLSFHATKILTTFEGGAVVCPDAQIKKRIDDLKNFGFQDELTVTVPGVNAKMSEFNAALGLLQLKYIDEVIARCRMIVERYRTALGGVAGIRLLAAPHETDWNASYCPVFVNREFPLTRDELYQVLKDAGVYARRYFYPLISDMPMYRKMPGAERVRSGAARAMAERVICLPVYPALTDEDVDYTVSVIKKVL